MTKFVLSTATTSVSFNTYRYVGDPNSKQGVLPVPKVKIVIHGGAGLPSTRSGFGEMSKDAEGTPMWTASGIVTPISDEKYEILKDHWLFKKFLENGHMKVLNSDITGNHKAVQKEVRTMEQHDSFSQLTPQNVKDRVASSQTKIKELTETQFRL